GRLQPARGRAVPHQPIVRRGDRLSHAVDAGGADAHAGGRDHRRAPADQLQARLLDPLEAGRRDPGHGAALHRAPRAARGLARLHDFGKVGVREQVLVKAKKLLPGELDRIRQRVELIKRGLELRYAGKKIDHLLEKGRRRYATQAADFDAELAAYVAELDQSLARIVAANEPAVLPRDFAAGIERLAVNLFEDHVGNREAVITPEEAKLLA